MKFQTKGLTSLLLFLAFLVLSVSGVVLYACPKGRVVYWTNWTLFGLSKEGWATIHVNIGILVLFVSGFHLYFNWKIFIKYIKEKTRWSFNLKKEIAAALLITVLFVLGSMVYVAPFSTTMDLKSQIEDFWEERAPKSPAPHAEEFSINYLALTIGLPVEDVLKTLRQEGFAVETRFMSVRQIGKIHGVAPSDVYAAITKHYRELKQAECGGRSGTCKRAEQSRSDP